MRSGKASVDFQSPTAPGRAARVVEPFCSEEKRSGKRSFSDASQKTDELMTRRSPRAATGKLPCFSVSLPDVGTLSHFQGDSAWMPNSAARALLAALPPPSMCGYNKAHGEKEQG